MKRFNIVIGANYGDEGKGLVSYCLSKEAAKRSEKVLNVLFNGGSQRAHTAAGRIVHCTGAGISEGADTQYGPRFLVDPIALWLEEARVYIDPSCRVVLPSDVILNRSVELVRGEQRHGSCGMGIFNACKRSETPQYRVTAKDMFGSKRNLYDTLIRIEQVFGYPRDPLYCNSNFMRACEWVIENCTLRSADTAMRDYETVIFEGGQGLLLDQSNRDDFPHLTPSSTGVRNIQEIFPKRPLGEHFDIYYVSRSYQTRHGAGPMENECHMDNINPIIRDETNRTNPWQGSIRYGYLDNEKLFERVKKDAEELETVGAIKPRINLVYTHLNYTNGRLTAPDGTLKKIEKPDFISHVYGSDKKDFMEVLI